MSTVSTPAQRLKMPTMNLSYWLGYNFFKLCARGFFNYRVIGRERLDIPGAALIVSNHVSFLDPPFVGIAFDEAIHYLAKKPLFSHPIAGAIFRSWSAIPVDQDRPDMASLKTVIRHLKAGEKVLLFPEGNRSPDGTLQKGEPGIGFIVTKVPVPVIPVHIFGTYEALPRDTMCLHPSEITVVIGNPWHYDASRYHETGKELYQKISAELMAEISELTL